MSGNSGWLSLVVDEGQPAVAVGVVVRLRANHCLVSHGGTVWTTADGEVSASPVVELQASDEGVDLGSVEREGTRLAGHLRERTLHVTATEPASAEVMYRRFPAAADQMSSSRLPIRSGLERELMRDGLLLDVWQPSPSEPLVALATDTARVRSELGRVYGAGVTVIPSRWTPATLDAIEREFAATPLVKSLGRRIGPDRQMQVAVTLLHLPTPLAQALERLPLDAIHLDVLVQPASRLPSPVR